jgi:hypothetical protein
MKKYIWTYKSKKCEINENNIDDLCEKINSVEEENINKWMIYNYLQKKVINPKPIVLNITRKQI